MTIAYPPSRGGARDAARDQRLIAVDGRHARLRYAGWRRVRLALQPPSPTEPLSGLYISQSGHALMALASAIQEAGLGGSLGRLRLPTGDFFGEPLVLGAGRFWNERPLASRVAVLLPCIAYGDALALAGAFGVARALRPSLRFDAYLNPCCDAGARVFRMSDAISRIRFLPVCLSGLLRYDAVVDLHDLRFSRELPLVESALAALGIDQEATRLSKVDRLLRRGRPSDLIARRLGELRGNGERLVLVCTRASTPVRTMPAQFAHDLCSSAPPGWQLISAEPNAPGPASSVARLSRDFRSFVHIASKCDAIVTVDSAAMYVAAALGKPCVAFFTNNIGVVWAAPYPKVLPIQVGDPGPLAAVHGGDEAALVGYASSQWERVDPRGAWNVLEDVWGERVALAGRRSL